MSANLPPIPPSPSVPAPPPPPPPATPAGGYGGSRRSGGSDIEVGPWLSEAWNVVMANPVPLIIGFLVITVAITVSALVVVGPFILAGPFLVALTVVAKRCLDNQSPEIGELFSGFQDFARTCVAGLLFMAVMVAAVVVNLILSFVLSFIPCLGTIIGFALGIVLQIAATALTFMFIPAVAFRSDLQPVDALTRSIQFATANLQPVGILAAVVTGLQVAGMLACGVGILVTAPLAIVFQVIAYERYYLPRS